MEGPLLWYASRGTGVTLLVLLSLSTVLGILSTGRFRHDRWPRALTQGLHRDIGLLSCALLVAHILTVVLDEFVDVRWWHVLVPFTGSYEQVWLGLGTLASDLIIAVILTSLARRRLGHGPWRAVHMTTYAAWWLGVVHGLMIGTDSADLWSRAITWTCVALVVTAAAYRIWAVARERTVTA
jgi:predicted ferric reductase